MSPDEPIGCVVGDDHPAILSAVAHYFEECGIAVMGLARHGEEALALIERHRPRVAVLDVEMPRLGGVEVARRAARSSPGTAVVFYTGQRQERVLAEALDVGARGFVLKDAPLAELARAVEMVAVDDGAYVDPALATALLRPASERLHGLTARERDILRLLADGLRYEEIGKQLFIAPDTVRTHVRKAMSKLDADTRTHAVAKALRESLIT